MVPPLRLSHGTKTGSRSANLFASGCSAQDPCRSLLSNQRILDGTPASRPTQRELSAWRLASLFRVSCSQYLILEITECSTTGADFFILLLYEVNIKPASILKHKYAVKLLNVSLPFSYCGLKTQLCLDSPSLHTSRRAGGGSGGKQSGSVGVSDRGSPSAQPVLGEGW